MRRNVVPCANWADWSSSYKHQLLPKPFINGWYSLPMIKLLTPHRKLDDIVPRSVSEGYRGRRMNDHQYAILLGLRIKTTWQDSARVHERNEKWQIVPAFMNDTRKEEAEIFKKKKKEVFNTGIFSISPRLVRVRKSLVLRPLYSKDKNFEITLDANDCYQYRPFARDRLRQFCTSSSAPIINSIGIRTRRARQSQDEWHALPKLSLHADAGQTMVIYDR